MADYIEQDGCVDSTTVDHGGIRFHILLNRDDDSDPRTDGDWASPADINAWLHDDWQYVDVTITSDAIPACLFSLTSVHYGTSERWSVTTSDIVKRAETEGWFDDAVKQLSGLLAAMAERIAERQKDVTTYLRERNL